ncbi:MAG: pyrroline-5-carboxylate reductase [Candidatus Eutrophobiaceae bacterium]
MLSNCRIAVFGCGNMGRALILGMLSGGISAKRIVAVDPVSARRKDLEIAAPGIHTTENGGAALDHINAIILAVKPSSIKDLLVSVKGSLEQQTPPLIISIAAGLRLDALARWASINFLPIVRAMPNTPAQIGLGVTGMSANESVTDSHRKLADMIMGCVGEVFWCEEEALLDAVTAVSGSGPAYFFLFMECLEVAAVKHGLSPTLARKMVLETAEGAVSLAKSSSLSFADLRLQVTSLGGTTEYAVAAFKQNGLENCVSSAVAAAHERSKELSEEAG